MLYKKSISFYLKQRKDIFLDPRLNYSDACAYDAAYKPTMSCPTVSGVCNCPLYLPDYSCNCLNTQFYNSVTSQCGKKINFYFITLLVFI